MQTDYVNPYTLQTSPSDQNFFQSNTLRSPLKSISTKLNPLTFPKIPRILFLDSKNLTFIRRTEKLNLGISKELNYNLYSNSERAEQVRNLFTPELTELAMLHFNEVSTQHELEIIANFILYGKDPKSDKNFCQKKEIQIKRAHRTYEKKEPESLDALLEETLGEEVNLSPLGSRPIYKKTKPTIDRERDKDIPGMQDLWVAIDKLAAQVSALKENNELRT